MPPVATFKTTSGSGKPPPARRRYQWEKLQKPGDWFAIYSTDLALEDTIRSQASKMGRRRNVLLQVNRIKDDKGKHRGLRVVLVRMRNPKPRGINV